MTEFCFYEMSVKTLTPQGVGNQANGTAKIKKKTRAEAVFAIL